MPKSYKPTRIFHLRSEDASIRGSGVNTSTDLYYNLDQSLTPEANEALIVSINGAEIPRSNFTVNTQSNIVNFFESSDATAGNLAEKNNVTLTIAGYTGDELATELARAINASNGRSDYTCVFDGSTNKLTVTQPTDISFALDFNEDGNSSIYAHKLLGFDRGDKIATDNGGNQTLTGDTPANVSGDNALYIRSPLSNINSFESRHGGTSDILSKIPIKVNYGDIIFYEPTDVTIFKSQLPRGQALNDLTIRLTNKNNELIDLVGLEWEFSLVVETILVN